MTGDKVEGVPASGEGLSTDTQVASPLRFGELVQYGDAAVVSRTLSKGSGGTLTVFAFDRAQELSEHSAPFDAWVLVLEGRGRFDVGGRRMEAVAGEAVHFPAHVPHAVYAVQRFKMLLVMLKHR